MKKYHHVRVGSQHSGGRVRTISFGSNIKARMSYPRGSKKTKNRAKRGKGKGRVISLLFSPQKFTLAEAKQWAKSHGYTVKKTAKADVKRKTKRRRKNPVRVKVKNKGILEVPSGKKVTQLPVSHFKRLANRKGHAAVSRALTNLERWNKNKNRSLSRWASGMKSKLRSALGAAKKKTKRRVRRKSKSRAKRRVRKSRSKRKARKKSRK